MITGSIVAIVTPMHDDGEVDHKALGELVERQIDAGTSAIVSVGTTGESSTLSVLEHTEVMRRTIEVANGRVPVIAGTGANSTDEAVHLTRAARAAGADGALLVTPYYNKPPQEGLYQHFKRIAETVAIPQYLYNVPGRTACDLLPTTVARLAEIPNIVGLKEAKGDLDRVRELVALGLDDFALYSGDDGTARASMLAGFHGDISVTANVAPEPMARMCKAGGAALGLGLLPSAGLFAIVSVLLLLAVRPVAKRKLQERMGSLERHQDRFVGSAAEVVQRVDGEGGQVRIGKEVWSARSMDGREVLEAGTTVTVLQVTGAAVLVTGRGELPAS